MIKVFTVSAFMFYAGFQCVGQTLSADQSTAIDTTSTPLNEVIINENRLQTPFTEQNRNINIISREQINALPARSVNELLTYIAGVDVRQRGPWGAQADVSIDGGTFEQTTILVNGIKVNDPQTAHHSMNIPVPMGAIERIEIIKGPAARIYGINSLTGAINIITRIPAEDNFQASVNVASSLKSKENEKGIYHARGVQIGKGFANTNSNHLIYGGHESGNGYRYNTPFNNSKLFYQGNIATDKEGIWSFMAGYTFNDFGANGYYAAPNDKESKEIVQTGIFSVGYKKQLSKWSISPRVSYRYNHDDYRYNQYDLSLFRNLHHSHVINTEVNSTYKNKYGAFGVGLEMRNEFLLSTNMGDRDRSNYGLYAEYKTDLIKKLSLNMGAYLNYNSRFGWQVYPGLDVGYHLFGNWRIYVNAGSGQRIPSFTDLYTAGGGNVGNPNLKAENAWYAEGGMKYNDEKWFLNASYFYREINDFIDWTRPSTNESWRANNFMRNQVQGLNLTTQYKINTQQEYHWLTSVSYTYLNPKVTNASSDDMLSKYAIESLKHQLVGSVIFRTSHFSISAAQRFVERVSYRNYFLTDLKLGYKWNKYGVNIDANNLFDVTYVEAAAIPLPGRWFNLGISCAI